MHIIYATLAYPNIFFAKKNLRNQNKRESSGSGKQNSGTLISNGATTASAFASSFPVLDQLLIDPPIIIITCPPSHPPPPPPLQWSQWICARAVGTSRWACWPAPRHHQTVLVARCYHRCCFVGNSPAASILLELLAAVVWGSDDEKGWEMKMRKKNKWKWWKYAHNKCTDP